MDELGSRMDKLRIGGLDWIEELPNLTRSRMDELGSRMDELLRIGGLDRISELPDHLLHHILSFIPTKYVVQTRLLSRTWRRVCSSYPIFEFNLHNYSQRFEQRERYIKFFDNTMQRFHRHETDMQKLNIFASIEGAPEFVRVVDRWIQISLEKKVQELDIRIYRYDLPQAIFASKSLHTLCLVGITMPSIFTTYTRVFSLRKLSLCGVNLKEQTLQDLFFKFPSIENLALLSGAEGGGLFPIELKKIRVSGLWNLKELTIFAWQALEEVDINAPSLKFFHYGSDSDNNIKIKMGVTKNVETLSITLDITMTNQRFHDLISKFPLLKCLHVERCLMLKEIKISSNRLQRFSFVDSCMPLLVKVEIDAPNLIFFEYSGRVEPGAILLVKTAPSCCSKAHINLKYHGDSRCFISLRKFLTSSMQFKFLSLQIFAEKSIIGKCFFEQLLPLPYQVEQLQLDLHSPSSTYAAILDNLLQVCRPMTVIALQDLALQDHYELIIKYLYEALLSREDLSCCNSRHVKCWKHYLKDVKIRSRIEGIEVERPLCLKTMPTLQWNQKICLILKWS